MAGHAATSRVNQAAKSADARLVVVRPVDLHPSIAHRNRRAASSQDGLAPVPAQLRAAGCRRWSAALWAPMSVVITLKRRLPNPALRRAWTNDCIEAPSAPCSPITERGPLHHEHHVQSARCACWRLTALDATVACVGHGIRDRPTRPGPALPRRRWMLGAGCSRLPGRTRGQPGSQCAPGSRAYHFSATTLAAKTSSQGWQSVPAATGHR